MTEDIGNKVIVELVGGPLHGEIKIIPLNFTSITMIENNHEANFYDYSLAIRYREIVYKQHPEHPNLFYYVHDLPSHQNCRCGG